MGSKKKIRISLTVKLLAMFLTVLLTSVLVVGSISYTTTITEMKKSVYSRIDSICSDVVNEIEAINVKNFTSLHFLAGLAMIKDESVPLAEKQRELTSVLKSLGGNYENVAFYDADGNAITADGRFINMKTRIYFTEAMAGKDYVSNPTFSPVVNGVLQQYSVPVYNKNNKIIGAIVMLIKGNAMTEVIQNIDMGGGMHPSVINYVDGVTIANVNENVDENSQQQDLDQTQGLGKILQEIFAGREDIADFVDPNIHVHLIAAYKKVPGTTWTVFAVGPYDIYFEFIRKNQIIIGIVSTIIVIISIIVVSLLVSYLIKPLRAVKNSIATIASGNADLTQRLPNASNDEIGDVVEGFNAFIAKLHDIVTNLQNSKTSLVTVDSDLQASTQDASASITEIISNIESVNMQIVNQANSVQETAGAVNEISANIGSLENMIESQAACVTQASAAVEQMIGNINSVNTSVGKMISSFTVLKEHSNEGVTTQNNANEKIMRIEEQSKMLQDANSAISAIAEQTNLLAMNAAIEAAHAGDAGKGVAVVADEIRKLSETSTDQSKTIGNELQKIQETIENVVEASEATNKAFSAISESISETSQIVEQIKGAMEEQQIGSKQIIDALQSMNNSTAEVHAASNEMTEGNKQILAEVQKLQNATDTMKDSISEMDTGARRINETGAALTVISGQVAENIKQIGSEIDLFKV